MSGVCVPGFKPSRNAFHFRNEFQPGPVMQIAVPGLGSLPIGNASGGLCGGMVFTVMDLFNHRLPPPLGTKAPTPGSAAFHYLTRRLLDSFNGVRGIFNYFQWMTHPENGRPSKKSISWHALHREWPAIKREIDCGQRCPLGLIRVESFNPFKLPLNHQVLAYAYELDTKDNLRIWVYDPNLPDDDDVTLWLNIADSSAPSSIAYSGDFIRETG
jgi:hypothetical protein